MKNSFTVLPSTGYLNDQFRVIAHQNELDVSVSLNGEIVQSVTVNKSDLAFLTNLDRPGTYEVKSVVNSIETVKHIRVHDAFRMGSSVLKNAYTFDDMDYSFFVMKDRLFILDENRNEFYCENGISPSEIRKVNKRCVLFVTNKIDGTINYGLFSIDTLTLIGECLNDFQELLFMPEHNRIWCIDTSTSEIVCLQISSKAGENLSRIRSYDLAENYHIRENEILIQQEDKTTSVDLNTLQEFSIVNNVNSALDIYGYYYQFSSEGFLLWYKKISSEKVLNVSCPYNFKQTLNQNDFLYLPEKWLVPDITKLYSDDVSRLCNWFESVGKTKGRQYLDESQRISRKVDSATLYPSENGAYIFFQERISTLWSIRIASQKPYFRDKTKRELSFLTNSAFKSLNPDNSSLLWVRGLFQNVLLVKIGINSYYAYKNGNPMILNTDREPQMVNLSPDSAPHALLENTNQGDSQVFTLINLNSPDRPVFERKKLINRKLISNHRAVWYLSEFSNNGKAISSYDGINKRGATFTRIGHTAGVSGFKLEDHYFQSSTGIIINAQTGDVKDAPVGNVVSFSDSLDKLICRRANEFYLLKYDGNSKKYVMNKGAMIPFDSIDSTFTEAHISPVGDHIILRENKGYLRYRFDENTFETIEFDTGDFVSFDSQGNYLLATIDEKNVRNVNVFDQKTLKQITPPGFHYYRFQSPDGKLYAELSGKVEYFNVVEARKFTSDEYTDFIRTYTTLTEFQLNALRETAPGRARLIINNRENYIKRHLTAFEKESIDTDPKNFNIKDLVRSTRYFIIGVVGTEIKQRVILPDFLQFYNYSSFSYDNRFLAFTGKPEMDINGGFFKLLKIDYDPQNQILNILDSFTPIHIHGNSDYKANWKCGFSKLGLFATYDSCPRTFVLNPNEVFNKREEDLELDCSDVDSRTLETPNTCSWKQLRERNFICFSPSGRYMAMSKQGYNPLSIGGSGHQESNDIHIVEVDSLVEKVSFCDHGDDIKNIHSTNVCFVGFTEDEKRLMTMSKDGVVIVRNINLE